MGISIKKHRSSGLRLQRCSDFDRATGLKSFTSHKKTIIGVFSVFTVAFLAAFVSSSILAPTNTSDATNVVTANITNQGYYVKINSSDVAMNLYTTPGGAMTVVNSTVKAATNSPSGYKLYLGMSPLDASGNPKSAADRQKNGLYLDGDLSRTDGEVLTAVGGSAATPAALTDNTWGYAVDKNNIGVPAVWSTLDHSTMSSSTPTNDKFAAVPVVGNEDLIQTTTTGNVPVSTHEEDLKPGDYTTANVYYGVRGTMAKTSGTYLNTIAYTAVAQAGPQPGSLSFTPTIYTRDAPYETMVWDDTVQILTPVYTNMDDLGTATVTLSGGPQNASGLTCGNPALSTVDNLLAVTCTLPQAYAGEYNVHVVLNKFSQEFDAKYTYAVTWDSISAMQEMTTSVCDSQPTPSTSATTVPEKFLTDLRGGGGHINPTTGAYQEAYTGKYRIRKLADGNCWMTENMDLPQGESTTFYSYNTNLTADPNDSSIDQDSYSVAADGTISWTPTNVEGTCTGTPTCSPNTINTTGQIDTNNKNAHSYNGNGSEGTRTIDTKACDKSTNDKCPVTTTTTETQNIGTYYNYAAATAQSGTYTAGADAANSICPYGWRLPYATGTGTNKSFYKLLFDTYGLADNDANSSTAAQSFPLSFVFSGGYFWDTGRGSVYYQGGSGYWWSSLSNGSTASYNLSMGSSRLIPQSSNHKLFGRSVRCVQN